MTTVRDMIADMREDLRQHRSETREDFQRLHERVDELRTELATERTARHENEAKHAATKAWVKGAYAALVATATALAGAIGWFLHAIPFVLAGALLSGCADRGHWGLIRPVTVLIDQSMPSDMRAAAHEAVEFWRALGADYLHAEDAPGALPAFRGLPWLGEIAVSRDKAPEPNVAGHTQCRRAGAELAACSVMLVNPASARHELGHALGLPDTKAEGRIMSWGLNIAGDEVTSWERAWIR